MTGAPPNDVSRQVRNGLPQQAKAAVRFTVTLPFKVAGKLIQHTAQIVFAVYVLFFHPQLLWAYRVIADSALVRNYVRPSLRVFGIYLFDPYFALLGRLPPYWAAFSVGLPLALLEPAKIAATIEAVKRPKAGIAMWLVLQAVGLLLIDRTWTAVRPQARKLWLVSRAHAWMWLNAEYGKHRIRNSAIYRNAVLWGLKVRRFYRNTRRYWLGKRTGKPR